MEILVFILFLCLGLAIYRISNMRKYREQSEITKAELEKLQVELADAKSEITRLELSQITAEANLNSVTSSLEMITGETNKAMLQLCPRLCYMEISSAMHQYGVLRQSLKFNDQLMRQFLISMLAATYYKNGKTEHSALAIDTANKDTYFDYFKERLLFSRTGESLAIRGTEEFDAINYIVEQVLSHSEKDVIGLPKYKLVDVKELV